MFPEFYSRSRNSIIVRHLLRVAVLCVGVIGPSKFLTAVRWLSDTVFRNGQTCRTFREHYTQFVRQSV